MISEENKSCCPEGKTCEHCPRKRDLEKEEADRKAWIKSMDNDEVSESPTARRFRNLCDGKEACDSCQ